MKCFLLTCKATLCWIPLLSAWCLFRSVVSDPSGANSIIRDQGFTQTPTIVIILG